LICLVEEFPVNVRIPLAVAALALTLPLGACSRSDVASNAEAATTTVTVTEMAGAVPARATDVVNAAHQWAGGPDGTGIFSVGNQPRDGLAAAIPSGRYAVRVAPGAEHGHWMVCDSSLCGPGFQDHAEVIGNPIGQESSAMYIGPQARTLWVKDVVISPLID
jgi:hypothetical protein